MASIASEMGIAAPSTIARWVIRYAAEFVSRWAGFEMVIGKSYRGTGAQKPILMFLHIDVVEAKREDWTTDPFTFATHPLPPW